jgi:hypothetical protein
VWILKDIIGYTILPPARGFGEDSDHIFLYEFE